MTKALDRRQLLKRLGCLTFSSFPSVPPTAVCAATDIETVRADLFAVLEYGTPLQIEWHDLFDTLALCGNSPRLVSIALGVVDIERGAAPVIATHLRELVCRNSQSIAAAVVIIRGSKKALSLPRCKAVFNAATHVVESKNEQRTQMLFGIAPDETVVEGFRVTVVAGATCGCKPFNAAENGVIPSIARCWVPSSPRLPDV